MTDQADNNWISSLVSGTVRLNPNAKTRLELRIRQGPRLTVNREAFAQALNQRIGQLNEFLDRIYSVGMPEIHIRTRSSEPFIRVPVLTDRGLIDNIGISAVL